METNKARNVCAIADAVSLISTYQDELTSNEKEHIEDPLTLSRIVLRRVLGKIFSGFEIRKNAENYSIRCTDDDFYKAIDLYLVVHGYRSAHMDRLSQPLYNQLLSEVNEVSVLFNLFNGSYLSYKMRSERRIFLYVSFMPYTQFYGSDFADPAKLETRGLVRRVRDISSAVERIRNVKISPLGDKVLRFFNAFGQYSLTYVPAVIRRRGIDEEFIDYALAHVDQGFSGMVEGYTRLLEEKAQSEAQSAPPVQARPAPPQRPVVIETPIIRVENVPVANPTAASNPTAARVFSEALSRITQRRAEQAQEATQEVTRPEVAQDFAVPTSAGQQLFEEALRRRLANGQIAATSEDAILSFFDPTDFFLTVPADAIIAALKDRASEIDDEEYLALLHSYSQIPERSNLLQSYSKDIFDDLDVEKQGFYFKVSGGEITYCIYDKNNVLLQTEDYEAAISFYEKNFGQLEEIKYWEDVRLCLV